MNEKIQGGLLNTKDKKILHDIIVHEKIKYTGTVFETGGTHMASNELTRNTRVWILVQILCYPRVVCKHLDLIHLQYP